MNINSLKKLKNLLVLGANGNLGRSTLKFLKNHRSYLNKLYLLDQNDFHNDKELITALQAEYIKFQIDENDKSGLMRIIKKTKPDIVLDVSNAPTEFVLDIVSNYKKASYICCGFSTENRNPMGEELNNFLDRLEKKPKPTMPHILFSGMNPGNVNAWAAIGVKKFGVPNEITEMEYDTSRFKYKHEGKMVTWCIDEFIIELVTDPAELVTGDHKFKTLYPNSLYHYEDLGNLFSPILNLAFFPKGCIVSHEECITMGNRWDIPVKFLYTVNQDTITYMKNLYDQKGRVDQEDLIIGTNVKDPLIGADNIAVRLDYNDKVVYYFNAINNKDIKGVCSATAFQVCVGIYSALFTLIFNDLKPGIYFTEDLIDQYYAKFLMENLVVKEFVFKKFKNGKLRLISNDPNFKYGKGPLIKM